MKYNLHMCFICVRSKVLFMFTLCGSVSRDESWVRTVIVWPFPQSLLHFFPCTFWRQEKNGVKSFVSGLVSLFLHRGGSTWLKKLATSGSIFLLIPHCWEFLDEAKILPLTPGSIPQARYLAHYREAHPCPQCWYPFLALFPVSLCICVSQVIFGGL